MLSYITLHVPVGVLPIQFDMYYTCSEGTFNDKIMVAAKEIFPRGLYNNNITKSNCTFSKLINKFNELRNSSTNTASTISDIIQNIISDK